MSAQVLAVLLVGQQLVDQLGPLVGILAVEEGDRLVRRGEGAVQVEVEPAEERRVVGRAGGGELLRREFRVDLLVDEPGEILGAVRLLRAAGERRSREQPHRQEGRRNGRS